MDTTFMAAFVDELEKMGGMKRLGRIMRSIVKKKGPTGDIYAGGPHETGLHRAMERAAGKVRRRYEKLPHTGREGSRSIGGRFERGSPLRARADTAAVERLAKGTKHPEFRPI